MNELPLVLEDIKSGGGGGGAFEVQNVLEQTVK